MNKIPCVIHDSDLSLDNGWALPSWPELPSHVTLASQPLQSSWLFLCLLSSNWGRYFSGALLCWDTLFYPWSFPLLPWPKDSWERSFLLAREFLVQCVPQTLTQRCRVWWTNGEPVPLFHLLLTLWVKVISFHLTHCPDWQTTLTSNCSIGIKSAGKFLGNSLGPWLNF